MATRKPIKQIIDEINYGVDPFSFIIKENVGIIINPTVKDPAKIIAYLNLNEDIVNFQSSFTFTADREYRAFANEVARATNAPATFIYDWMKNGSTYEMRNGEETPSQNAVIKISEVALDLGATEIDNNIYVTQFNSRKTAEILENGIGKNFVWCKVAFKHTIDGRETTQYGYTKTENIIVNNSGKTLLTKGDFPTTTSATQLLSPEIREKLKSVSELSDIAASSIVECCPFLIMVIGSPFFPTSDQLFFFSLWDFDVLPKRIL